MSREVPLLASEKIKLGILIFFGVLILLSALAGARKKIYRMIVRDKEGYETAMQQISEKYYFEVIEYSETLNNFKLAVEPKAWASYDQDNRFKYCDACFEMIRKAQQKYKMVDEDVKPSIDFFVNSSLVGTVSGGYTTIK